MAVPNTGALCLYATIIGGEKGDAQGNNSLHDMSVYAGFSTPDAMSEFYGWSDVELGVITSQYATASTQSSLTLRNFISSTGGGTCSQGVYLGTQTTITSRPKYTGQTNITATGNYDVTASGLASNTQYKWSAWISNEAGEYIHNYTRYNSTDPPPFTPTLTCSGLNGANANSYADNQSFGSNEAGLYYYNPYTNAKNALQVNSCTGGTSAYYARQGYRSGGVASNAKNSVSTYVQGDLGPFGSNISQNAKVCTDNCLSSLSAAAYGPFVTYQFCRTSLFSGTSCINTCSGYFYNNGAGKQGGVPYPGTWGADLYFCFSDIRLKTNINYL